MATRNQYGADTTRDFADENPSLSAPGPGFRIGEYIIEDALGHGAMATVYLGTDDTGHEVALKVFQEGPGVSATMLERFRREAEASKKLRRHPHIMTIYSTGKEGPYQYIAMENIHRSKTFEAALESTPMTLNQIVHVVVKIARALQYAHNRHIVHRDVKLTNIMIDEFGEPLLADFGVAELIDWPSCTMTGALTGTPLYMSPEQARGERVGPASDIYSLGVVLYEAVTGVLPYHVHHRSRVKEVLEAVKNEPPRRPRLFRKEISNDLEAVMLKALEKDPRNRYPDAEAFAVDLERALAGKRVSAHHFSPLDRVRHFSRRHRQTIIASLLALAIGVTVNVFFRRELTQARFEGIIHLAQLRDVEHALQQATNGDSDTRDVPQAWQEIRQGRKAMYSGDWARARRFLAAAISHSDSVEDGRTAAIAKLDLARCLVMLEERDEARTLYREIMRNTVMTPTMKSLAEWELLLLTLVEHDRDAALNVLIEFGLPAYGPIRDALRCVSGEMSPEAMLAAIDGIPRRFRNDAYLAVALRHDIDGRTAASRDALRLCMKASAPSMEWPSPLAREIERKMSDIN